MKAFYILSLLTVALAAPQTDAEVSLSDFQGFVDVSDPVIQSTWNAAISFKEGDLQARAESELEPRACADPKGYARCIAVCNTGCAVGCRCGSCFQICPKSCSQGKWKGC